MDLVKKPLKVPHFNLLLLQEQKSEETLSTPLSVFLLLWPRVKTIWADRKTNVFTVMQSLHGENIHWDVFKGFLADRRGVTGVSDSIETNDEIWSTATQLNSHFEYGNRKAELLTTLVIILSKRLIWNFSVRLTALSCLKTWPWFKILKTVLI